ncbi:hypothetical protein ACQY1Q_17225 [Tenacibaculum sp. TC6]|uniref:hypothetical protein n=1 Tax=Tenacibaculum sp. TC6 TaxID=3423223 RepID=UPI003D368865
MNKTLDDKTKKIILICSNEHEYIYNFIQNVTEVFPEFSEDEIKNKVLDIIYYLLYKNILIMKNHKNEEAYKLTPDESIDLINQMWFKGASYIDFINMVFFEKQEWFIKELKKMGYNFKDNWIDFSKNNLFLNTLLF